jgi:hypothetical protein
MRDLLYLIFVKEELQLLLEVQLEVQPLAAYGPAVALAELSLRLQLI